MAPLLTFRMPKVYYSFGDGETGTKVIIMEDLSDLINAGYFFGPHNPFNWNKDLPSFIKEAKMRLSQVIQIVFLQAAKLHATFWKDESLLKEEWLKNALWLLGKDEEGWT